MGHKTWPKQNHFISNIESQESLGCQYLVLKIALFCVWFPVCDSVVFNVIALGAGMSNHAAGSSFGTVDSLSTIRGSEKAPPDGMTADEMQGIYAELQEINLKMKVGYIYYEV